MNENRIQIYTVSRDLIGALFSQGNGIQRLAVIDGPPKDAKIISINTDWQTDTVQIKCSHPSFEEVTAGAMPPVMYVQIVVTQDLSPKRRQELEEHIDNQENQTWTYNNYSTTRLKIHDTKAWDLSTPNLMTSGMAYTSWNCNTE